MANFLVRHMLHTHTYTQRHTNTHTYSSAKVTGKQKREAMQWLPIRRVHTYVCVCIYVYEWIPMCECICIYSYVHKCISIEMKSNCTKLRWGQKLQWERMDALSANTSPSNGLAIWFSNWVRGQFTLEHIHVCSLAYLWSFGMLCAIWSVKKLGKFFKNDKMKGIFAKNFSKNFNKLTLDEKKKEKKNGGRHMNFNGYSCWVRSNQKIIN